VTSTGAVIDAVGVEAHGSPIGALAYQITGLLTDSVAARMIDGDRRRRPVAGQVHIEVDRQ